MKGPACQYLSDEQTYAQPGAPPRCRIGATHVYPEYEDDDPLYLCPRHAAAVNKKERDECADDPEMDPDDWTSSLVTLAEYEKSI